MHPSLFEALILVDPVIQRDNPSRRFAPLSTYRRDLWPSRKQAVEKFQSSPFYQAWDPRVFEKWVEFGLRDLPTQAYPTESKETNPAVTLTTPKAQEVFTYLRPAYVDKRTGLACGDPREEMHPEDREDFPFYRPEPPQIFRRLPEIKPSVLYLFAEQSELSAPEARQAKVQTTGAGVGGSGGVARGRVQEAVLPCGHLVPMELVQESGKVSADFIGSELALWRARKARYLETWEKVPLQERVTIDKQWESHIGALPKRSKL
jgi:pimeloyl-ACP methyl ester carboxylesterase